MALGYKVRSLPEKSGLGLCGRSKGSFSRYEGTTLSQEMSR